MGDLKGFGADLATIELPNSITVGSFYGDQKKISSFSNIGRAYVDILADGQDVESYVAGGNMDKYSEPQRPRHRLQVMPQVYYKKISL